VDDIRQQEKYTFHRVRRRTQTAIELCVGREQLVILKMFVDLNNNIIFIDIGIRVVVFPCIVSRNEYSNWVTFKCIKVNTKIFQCPTRILYIYIYVFIQ